MPRWAAANVLLLLLPPTPTTAFLLPTWYASCESTWAGNVTAAQRPSLTGPAASAGGGAFFTMRDVADPDGACVGRVPHPLVPTTLQQQQQQPPWEILGWVPCTSPNVVRVRFALSTGRAVKTAISYSYRYVRFVPERTPVGSRVVKLCQFEVYQGTSTKLTIASYQYTGSTGEFPSPPSTTLLTDGTFASSADCIVDDQSANPTQANNVRLGFHPVTFDLGPAPSAYNNYKIGLESMVSRWRIEGADNALTGPWTVMDIISSRHPTSAQAWSTGDASRYWFGDMGVGVQPPLASANSWRFPASLPRPQMFKSGNVGRMTNTFDRRAVTTRFLKLEILASAQSTLAHGYPCCTTTEPCFAVADVKFAYQNVAIKRVPTLSTNEYVPPNPQCRDRSSNQLNIGFAYQFQDDPLRPLTNLVDENVLTEVGSTLRPDASGKSPGYVFDFGTDLVRVDSYQIWGSPTFAPVFWNPKPTSWRLSMSLDRVTWEVIDEVWPGGERHSPDLTGLGVSGISRTRWMPAVTYPTQLGRDFGTYGDTTTPIAIQRSPDNEWYRMEVETTQEIIVAAFYRDMTLLNAPACSTTGTTTVKPPKVILFHIVSPSRLGNLTQYGPDLGPGYNAIVDIQNRGGNTVLASTATQKHFMYGVRSTALKWPGGLSGDSGGSAPLEIPSSLFANQPITALAAMAGGAFVALVNGQVYTWGAQPEAGGQLGRGGSNWDVTDLIPQLLSGAHTGVVAVAAGTGHACFLKATGANPAVVYSLWCWGMGNLGQLGNGQLVHRNTPTQVTQLPLFVNTQPRLFLSGHTTTLLDPATSVTWTWGDSTDGVSGLGVKTSVPLPTPLQSLTSVTCLLNADDAIVQVFVAGKDVTSTLKPLASVGDWHVTKTLQFTEPPHMDAMFAVLIRDANGGGSGTVAGFAAVCSCSRPGSAWNFRTNSTTFTVVKALHPTNNDFGAGGSANWNGITLSGGLTETSPSLSTAPFVLDTLRASEYVKVWENPLTSPTGYAVFRRRVTQTPNSQVSCLLNADNRIVNVYVNGWDITSLVMGGDMTDWHVTKSVAFTSVSNAVFAVKVKDDEGGTATATAGFAAWCSCATSPAWTFVTDTASWTLVHSNVMSQDGFAIIDTNDFTLPAVASSVVEFQPPHVSTAPFTLTGTGVPAFTRLWHVFPPTAYVVFRRAVALETCVDWVVTTATKWCLTNRGAVYAMGSRFLGSSSDGLVSDASWFPKLVIVSGVAKLAKHSSSTDADPVHMCVILATTNEVQCWGTNAQQQLGLAIGVVSDRLVPTPMGLIPVQAQEVFLGVGTTCIKPPSLNGMRIMLHGCFPDTLGGTPSTRLFTTWMTGARGELTTSSTFTAYTDGSMTPEACARWAMANNFKYFGLQTAKHCMGSNDFNHITSLGLVSGEGCGTLCPMDMGASGQGWPGACGGSGENTVYELVPVPGVGEGGVDAVEATYCFGANNLGQTGHGKASPERFIAVTTVSAASVESAEWYCSKTFGTTLATINSAADLQAFQTTVSSSPGGASRLYWIGLSDRATEGAFRWSSLGTSVVPSVFLWGNGEPQGATADEDCVVASALAWFDTQCYQSPGTTFSIMCDATPTSRSRSMSQGTFAATLAQSFRGPVLTNNPALAEVTQFNVDLDAVHFSQLTRPVGDLFGPGPDVGSTALFRLAWYEGEDAHANFGGNYGIRGSTWVRRPTHSQALTAITPGGGCNSYDYAFDRTSLGAKPFVEMTRLLGGGGDRSVTTLRWGSPNFTSTLPVENSVAVHRFLGGAPKCPCGYVSDYIDSLGRCLRVNECPPVSLDGGITFALNPDGISTATCGANANCKDLGNATQGYSCMCIEGYSFSQSEFAQIRQATDVDAVTNEETNSCQRFPVDVESSSTSIRVRINSNAVALSGTTLIVNALTTSDQTASASPLFSGVIAQLQYIVLDSGELVYSRSIVSGRRFQTTFVASNNQTLYSPIFTLPCSCTTGVYQDVQIRTRERDDGNGHPVELLVTQFEGLVMLQWKDNSRCRSKFKVERLDADVGVLSSPFNDHLLLGASLNNVCPTGAGNALIKFNQKDDLKKDPVLFYVGSRHDYGVRAVAAQGESHALNYVYESRQTWATMYVSFEGSFMVKVTKDRGKLQAGVTVTWKPFLRLEDGETMVELLADATSQTDSSHGFAITDATGQALVQFRIACTPTLNPILRGATEVFMALTFSMVELVDVPVSTQYPTGVATIVHEFLCNDGTVECDPLGYMHGVKLFSLHLVNNYDLVSVIDNTFSSIQGRISLADTATPEHPEGCPAVGASVCMQRYVKPGSTLSAEKYDCVTTDAEGRYAVVVPIGARIEMQVDGIKYFSHAFEVLPGVTPSPWTVTPNPKQGVDFQSITKDRMFVDVAGGNCDREMATSAQVVLTAPDTCPDRVFTVPLTKQAGGSGVRFSAWVPAMVWQVTLNVLATVDANGGTRAGVNDFFASQYGGDHTPVLDLANATGRVPTTAPAVYPAYVSLRLLRFQYQSRVHSALLFFTTAQQAVRADSNISSCTTSGELLDGYQTRYLTPGPLNFVLARIEVWQEFPLGARCDNLTGGVIKVLNLLGRDPAPGEAGIDPLWTACRTAWCSLGVQVSDGKSYVELSLKAIAKATKPHAKDFTFQYLGVQYPAGITTTYAKTFVLGQAEQGRDDAFNTIQIPLAPMPVMVVRDPPGDMSYAYYKDVRSEVRWAFTDMETYQGHMNDFKFGTWASTDVGKLQFITAPLGVGVSAEVPLLHLDFSGGNGERGQNLSLTRVVHTRDEAVQSFTWSLTTAAGGNPVPGPDQDMFLVVEQLVYFIPVTTIFMDTACHAKALTVSTFSVKERDKGVAWMSRYQVNAHLLPSLNGKIAALSTTEASTTFITLYKPDGTTAKIPAMEYLTQGRDRWSTILEVQPPAGGGGQESRTTPYSPWDRPRTSS